MPLVFPVGLVPGCVTDRDLQHLLLIVLEAVRL